MKHLSDEFMLDVLSKVQPYQADVLKSGRSIHIDASVHEDIWAPGETHIDFDVNVFEDHSIVNSFDFSSSETEEQVEAVFASLVAYVHSL